MTGGTFTLDWIVGITLSVASLQSVDAVCAFSEDTPINVIKMLKPDVLAKGGDYKIDDIVGAKEVTSYGGKVEVIPYVEGYSTTKIESKIFFNNFVCQSNSVIRAFD